MNLSILLSIFLFSFGSYHLNDNDGPQPSRQKSVSKMPVFKEQNVRQDTTFTLKIENEKRVVDENLKAKLTKEIKSAIVRHHLTKPYNVAMGFTRGARDVETFLFGEQIFYTLAESGYVIKGKPLEFPDVAVNPVPQIKVVDKIIYVVLSKM